jgi:hypothetical protein
LLLVTVVSGRVTKVRNSLNLSGDVVGKWLFRIERNPQFVSQFVK